MRKFKLIKEYPGSPNLGTTCEERNNKSSFCYYFEGEKNIGITKDQVENQPEYWEEVVEKDYEILISRVVPQEILSVKRLSDGEVFTVGDTAMTEGSRGRHTIRQFRLRHKCIGKDATGTYLYGDLDTIWIDWEEGCGGNWLESTVKEKNPIFLTDDGKDIFDGDKVWYVNKRDFYKSYFIASKTQSFFSGTMAYFLTEAAASDYIEKNKVLFTTEDGVEIKKDEIVYVVDGRLTSIDMISNFKPENYPTMKAFSTSKAAEDYLIENKYALSIKDFWEFVCWGGSNFAKSKRLKRLVKERLGIK
jgi:hypothetical protein